MTKANILVPLSRPSLWSRVLLLRPLWPPGDHAARAACIQKYRTALQPQQDFVKEMKRLRALMAETKADLAEFLPASAA